MSENLDLTTAIGQAFVAQPDALFDSIQRLRDKAKDNGSLQTTQEQTVEVEREKISIQPAQPQYIYVPTYDPQIVYVPVNSGPSTGVVVARAITFTAGLLIGAWLNNDCDWYSHRVFYHGWHGRGWIGRSSVHIHVHNSIYVNARYSRINLNRTIVNRRVNYNNISHYSSVSRDLNYKNIKGTRDINRINNNNINTKDINRNPSTKDINRNPSTRDINRNPSTRDINRNPGNTDINRNPGTRDINRNPGTRDINRNPSTREVPSTKNIPRNLDRNINRDNRGLDSYRGKAPKSTTAPTTRMPSPQPRSGAFGGFGNGAQTRSMGDRGRTSRSISTPTPRSTPRRMPSISPRRGKR